MDGVELVGSLLIKDVHAVICLLPQCFLVVCKEEASELLSLEEVRSCKLLLWHRQNVCSR